jgi:hypothetical protein
MLNFSKFSTSPSSKINSGCAFAIHHSLTGKRRCDDGKSYRLQDVESDSVGARLRARCMCKSNILMRCGNLLLWYRRPYAGCYWAICSGANLSGLVLLVTCILKHVKCKRLILLSFELRARGEPAVYNRRVNEIASRERCLYQNGCDGGGGKRKWLLFTQLNGFNDVGKLVCPWFGFFLNIKKKK